MTVELLSIRYGHWFVTACDDVENAHALARAQSYDETASPDAIVVDGTVVEVRDLGDDFRAANADDRERRAELYRRATGREMAR